LLGGSTFALWTQSANLTAGNISTGTFGVEVDEDHVEAWDVSPDRGYTQAAVGGMKGRVINLAQFLMSPKDRVAVSIPITVTLDGDNLLAHLTADFSGFLAEDIADAADVSVSVFDSENTQLQDGVIGDGLESFDLGYYTSNQGWAGVTQVEEEEKSAEFTVIVVVDFNETSVPADGPQFAGKEINLGAANFTLTQVRENDGALGGFPSPNPTD
jgi:alternate signal-mediated exported protein